MCSSDLKFKDAADDLYDVATTIVENRLRNEIKRDDLLGLLLEAETKDGEKLTPAEVSDETLTLILSGHETTANVLTWAFSYLSEHPQYWVPLAAEAEVVFKHQGADDFALQIFSAPIVSTIFSEVLRLCPPVWVAPRRAINDVELGGIKVPRGAHVLMSQYVTHRDPRYFDNPDEFRPERWQKDFEKSLPRGAYFPFGAGTRKCLGDQFALLEGRIIILEIARQMRLKLEEVFPTAQPRATYRPKGRVPMKVLTKL